MRSRFPRAVRCGASVLGTLVAMGCTERQPADPSPAAGLPAVLFELQAPASDWIDLDGSKLPEPGASPTTAPGEPFPSLSGIAIAYDMSHNTGRQALTSPTGSNANSTIFGDFTGRGATISVITSFTGPVLSGFDVLWLEEDFATALSADDKAVLGSFVSDGGGVIICCEDWSVFTEPGSPLTVFGLGYTPGSLFGATANITPHPATDGVTTIVYSGSIRAFTVPPEATVLVRDAGGTQNGVAVRDFGSGRVVAVADELCINGAVDAADNRHLCNHLMDFAANRLFILVEIDVRPGSDENPINLGSRGTIPVAILTTADFDAASVDPSTVALGNDDGDDTPVATRKDGSFMAGLEDVDGDGDLDLVLHFSTEALVANGDLDANTSELVLTGETTGGTPIKGTDDVHIVPEA